MKNSSMKEGKVFFLNFIFNPALRTLQKDDTTQQLRKKQSDVLALLCAKYPDPVSQEEFLTEVWDGSYVTPQSIAQMIRSLRISLKDESKNIIVTIPKLGYQLTAEPSWEEPVPEQESLPGRTNGLIPALGKVEVTNISLSTNPHNNYQPPPAGTAMTVVSYAPKHKAVAKKIIPRKWFFSTVAMLCFTLICVAMSARGYTSIFSEEKTALLSHTFLTKYGGTKIIDNYFYCCKTESGMVCSPKAAMLLGKCKPYSETVEMD